MSLVLEEPSVSGRPAAKEWYGPPAALGGFMLLLAVTFAVAYGVGSLAGPVNPGMHPVRTGVHGNGGDGEGGHGGMGGMG